MIMNSIAGQDLKEPTLSYTIGTLLAKSRAGERLSPDEGLRLLESHDLAALAGAADDVCRRLHPEPYRTYNIDRNINYTNICTSGCRFCAFSRKPGDPQGYLISRTELFRKIEETVALGGDQILLQGGLHGELDLPWYEQLLRDIKRRFPQVNIHGFGPAEIVHIAAQSGLPPATVLERLKDAGLGSLPGGGAEILVDRVRQAVSPCKATADAWLDACRAWHELGGRGSATMMFGHVETLPSESNTWSDCAACRTRRTALPPLSVGRFSRVIPSCPICPSAVRRSTSRCWPSAGYIWTISPTCRPVG